MSERVCLTGGDDVATVLLPARRSGGPRAPRLVDGTPIDARAASLDVAERVQRSQAEARAKVAGGSTSFAQISAVLPTMLVRGAMQRGLNGAMDLRVFHTRPRKYPSLGPGADVFLLRMALRVVYHVFQRSQQTGVMSVSVLNSCTVKMLSVPSELEWTEEEDDVLDALYHKKACKASERRTASAQFLTFGPLLKLLKGPVVVQYSRLHRDDTHIPAAVIKFYKRDAFRSGKYVTGDAFLKALIAFIVVRILLCAAFTIRKTQQQETGLVIDQRFLESLNLSKWFMNLSEAVAFHGGHATEDESKDKEELRPAARRATGDRGKGVASKKKTQRSRKRKRGGTKPANFTHLTIN